MIKQRAVTLSCFAFVDDTDLIHSVQDPTIPTQQLLAEAQQALATWEGLIRASGGALAPEKSYWYLVDVRRIGGKWRYANIAANPGELHLQNGQFLDKRLEVNQANEALGIQIRPDCNMRDEVKYLQAKAIKWADAL